MTVSPSLTLALLLALGLAGYALLALAPVAAVTVAAVRVGTGTGERGEDTPTVHEVPLEWKGFAVPWEANDVDELDRALGMNEVQLHGAP